MDSSDMNGSGMRQRPRRSETGASRPLATALLSVMLFFALDACLFRSGWYARFQKPNQPAGSMMAIIRFTRAAPSNPKRDVLVIGNSKVEYGLSISKIEKQYPAAPFRLILGAIPGSNEEYWYCALNQIDPGHDRYAAVVIALSGYKATPDWADSVDTVQVVTPIVPIRHLAEFLTSFDDPALRRRALMIALFSSHDYAPDLQNFIIHPVQRLNEIGVRNAQGVNYLYGQDGQPETMNDLRIAPDGKTVLAYPARFNILYREDMDQYFRAPPPELAEPWTRRNAAFRQRWLGKIAYAYKDSRTRLIFVSMPQHPVPLPALQPLPDAPDIHDLLPKQRNITIVPEQVFADVERPAYFIDLKHLNGAGSVLFSKEFGRMMTSLLGNVRS